MSPKIFVVVALLAATLLFVSDAASPVKLVDTASALVHVDQASPQASCYFCGIILSGRCKCCVSNSKSTQTSEVSAMSLVDTMAASAYGNKVDPQANCRFCGYFAAGRCRCCVSAA